MILHVYEHICTAPAHTRADVMVPSHIHDSALKVRKGERASNRVVLLRVEACHSGHVQATLHRAFAGALCIYWGNARVLPSRAVEKEQTKASLFTPPPIISHGHHSSVIITSHHETTLATTYSTRTPTLTLLWHSARPNARPHQHRPYP